jgi:hypothetical protein
MRGLPGDLREVVLIEPDVSGDKRGFFLETAYVMPVSIGSRATPGLLLRS